MSHYFNLILPLLIGFSFLSAGNPLILMEELPNDPATISVHVPTIEEIAPNQLVAAWWGGLEQGAENVKIWFSKNQDGIWCKPIPIASSDEIDPENKTPCWDPVLYKHTKTKKLFLFYKIGPSPREWSGFMKVSSDNGTAWSKATTLPPGILGPTKNKPLLLPDGTMLCGSSLERCNQWSCRIESLSIGTQEAEYNWKEPSCSLFHEKQILNVRGRIGITQPAIFWCTDGRIRMICRSKRLGFLCTSTSSNNGISWAPITETTLQSNDSAIDAIRLKDGRILLAYNNLPEGKRYKLDLAISPDDGRSWKNILILDQSKDENVQICFPSLLQSADGLVHVLYTNDRKSIKHAIIDPTKLISRPPSE